MAPRRGRDEPEQPAIQNPLLESIVGFGPGSMRKSYYPELRRRLQELEHFRTLFDAGNDLILLVELPSGIITDANLPACRRLGWPREELLGRRIAKVLDGGDLDSCLTGDGERASTQLEMYFRSRTGDCFPVELTCRITPGTAYRAGEPISAENRLALIVARDITDRRSYECALRAAKEEAERANLAKTRFLAAASHDLRQPAQSLNLFTSLLADMLVGHPAAAVIEHQRISVEALGLLLDGILDVSKLDAGLVEAAPKAFPIATMFRRLANEFQEKATGKGLRFTIVTSRLMVFSDPILLERIVRNLVENAIRYTSSGGIVIGCRKRGRTVFIEVLDSGIGMAPEHQENVFEEFVQLGNSARDRQLGLGLGLAIVRRLSQLLGHEVTVRSVEGRGSSFSIAVPWAEAKAPEL